LSENSLVIPDIFLTDLRNIITITLISIVMARDKTTDLIRISWRGSPILVKNKTPRKKTNKPICNIILCITGKGKFNLYTIEEEI